MIAVFERGGKTGDKQTIGRIPWNNVSWRLVERRKRLKVACVHRWVRDRKVVFGPGIEEDGSPVLMWATAKVVMGFPNAEL
jgi:hypothetical protein